MLLLDGLSIKSFVFSGGEVQVKLPEKIDKERVILTWKPHDSRHVFELLLTVNALNHAGIEDIDIDVLYLPYARQDRVCAKGEACSLEVMIDILNRLPVSLIRFFDVHNFSKIDELMTNTFWRHTDCNDIFNRYKILDDFELSNLILCAADSSSLSRVTPLCRMASIGDPVFFNKIRDTESGEITTMELDKRCRNVEGYNVFVIDDICDGGRTFIEAAKILKGYGAENLYLYVTHAIFSKGLDTLREHYKHIFCHHVLQDFLYVSTDYLTILREEHAY